MTIKRLLISIFIWLLLILTTKMQPNEMVPCLSSSSSCGNGTSTKPSCSSNLNCDCFPLAVYSNSSTKAICAYILPCDAVVPCNSSNKFACSTVPNTVCVNGTRCQQPVCYPLALTNAKICPPAVSTKTSTTTIATIIRSTTLLPTTKITTKITTYRSTTTPSTTFKLSTTTSISKQNILCSSAMWSPNGITVAGVGNGNWGSAMNKLSYPRDIAIDSHQNLIIADNGNDRIQKYFTSNGTIITLLRNVGVFNVFIDRYDNIYYDDYSSVQKLSNDSLIVTTTVAGDNRTQGNKTNQLNEPQGLYIDRFGNVYVSDSANHRVMKWLVNASEGIVVAGGNGNGSASNQLSYPKHIFVDEVNEVGAIYICDFMNMRIQKWLPGAQLGITVAGGNGIGGGLNQLFYPDSIILDPITRIMYLADYGNNRIVKWLPNAQQGQIIAGGNGQGTGVNQFFRPLGIKFDSSNWNLFVTDWANSRIQKFLFNVSSC
ncbi:unnamed protein product [Rotaria sordida]|uniref:NHL repeat-containing protein n=2 Tax=Rotaria sordida TaxID=392033 RepID=A0A814APP7_9BILA|nr:unnamed protein product [Rotaria sordida]